MEQKRNRIVVHALGGCGINLADKVFNLGGIDNLGNGFAEIVYNYVDTSMANISKITPKGNFFKIDTEAHSKGVITGSGGEAGAHVKDIMAGIDKYLDSIGLLKQDNFEYHMLLSSCSGGSGRVISYFLLDKLLQRNLPVINILVGDSSNALYAANTKNTLGSLNNLAIKHNKAITTIYVNNANISNKETPRQEIEANINNRLKGVITGICLFLSGQNEFIDNQDMVNIINPSNYTTINVKPGIYGLMLYSKNYIESLPKDGVPIIGRTLTVGEEAIIMPYDLLHHKHGNITEETPINMYSNSLPIHMVLCANYLTAEEQQLGNTTDSYYNLMDNVTVKNISGTSRSKEDETGLVL